MSCGANLIKITVGSWYPGDAELFLPGQQNKTTTGCRGFAVPADFTVRGWGWVVILKVF